jgi:putative SOS response-associated peptidase YedK
MPVLLAPEHWPAWLGESRASDSDLRAMLRPYPAAAMACWPVDRRVGNVRNDDPDLLTPLAEQILSI